MQQIKQNTYTVLKQSYNNITSTSQLLFKLIPGVYDIECSVISIEANTITSANVGEVDVVYTRSDCFIPCASNCQIQKDSKLIANYVNLALAQLEYIQHSSQDQDQIADFYAPLGANYPCLTKKRWKRLGVQADGATPQKYSIGFRFKHFFPHIASDDKYLFVDKTMDINLSFANFDNSTFLAFQPTGNQINVTATNVLDTEAPPVPVNVVTYPNTGYFNVTGGSIGTDLQSCDYTNQNADPINIFIHMKKVNADTFLQQIPRPTMQSYYTQQQSANNSDVFNQSIGAHQISKHQSISFIPLQNKPRQFNFEDIPDTITANIKIQRQGCPVVDSVTLSGAKSQSLLWKEGYKDDCQNLIIRFDEILVGTNLQTTFQSNLTSINVIAGLQYFEQL